LSQASASLPLSQANARDAVYGRLTRRLIPMLLFCYVCSYLDRVNVGFAKLQMLGDLNFSETVYGLGAGIFFIGYVLFEVPSNLIMIRVGARFWIGRIMVTWGLISAAMIFVKSPASFYVLRFLLGIAEAGLIPAALYYLSTWFPAQRRGKATALFMFGIPLSGVIGGPLSGWIIGSLSHAGGLAGWQWMFLIEALPAVIGGIVAYFYLNDSAAAAPWLSDDEKSIIASDLAAEARQKSLHSIRQGLTDGKIWYLSGLYMAFTMGLYAVSFWLPSIIRSSGVKDPLSVGLLTAIPYAAALPAMYFTGRSSDRSHERRWHLAGPALLGALGLIVSVHFATETAYAMVALTLATAGILTCIPQFYTLLPAILGGAAAAMGFALANSVGSIAGFISPYLLGYVKDLTGSTNNGVLIIAACLVLGGGLVFFVPAKLVNR
jgi:MFS family permease